VCVCPAVRGSDHRTCKFCFRKVECEALHVRVEPVLTSAAGHLSFVLCCVLCYVVLCVMLCCVVWSLLNCYDFIDFAKK
jgi:hypothetical protein